MKRPGSPRSARGTATTLLLVRHGESADNAAGRWSGGRDVPLTANGRRQARRLAAHLAAAFHLDALYSSPLSRAWATARYIGRRAGATPVPVDGLREWALGRLEGQTSTRARPAPIATLAVQAGGETQEEFCTRVMGAMHRIIQAHPGRLVAVVTHGGPLAAFLATTLHGNPARWVDFRMDNGALTIVRVSRAGASLHVFNARVPPPPARRRAQVRHREAH